jgi:hypothetical protein
MAIKPSDLTDINAMPLRLRLHVHREEERAVSNRSRRPKRRCRFRCVGARSKLQQNLGKKAGAIVETGLSSLLAEGPFPESRVSHEGAPQ